MKRRRPGLLAFIGLAILFAACGRQQGSQPASAYLHEPQARFMRGGGAATTLSATQSQALRVGDAVTVDSVGKARLRFVDYLVVDVFRDSDLRITGMADPNAPPAYRLRLEGGTLNGTLDAQGLAAQRVQPEVVVDTQWAVIKALGTVFFIHYDRQRELTWVVVKRGRVSVTAGGIEVIVEEGQQTWVEPNGTPVGPLRACRSLVGNLFPLVDDLTTNYIPDLALLCQEDVRPTATSTRAAPSVLTATPRVRPTVPPTRSRGTSTPAVACERLVPLSPGDGAVFAGPDAGIQLSWGSVGELAEGMQYQVISVFPHQGATWTDTQTTRNTSLTLPRYLYDLLTDSRRLDWRVTVLQVSPASPNGAAICPSSASRSLVWRLKPPTATPVPPSTPTPLSPYDICFGDCMSTCDPAYPPYPWSSCSDYCASYCG